MKELICIVCPNSCILSVDEKTKAVSGNKCSRGEKFALEEISHPMRSLTSTVATVFADCPVISVKTDGEIPKEKIFAVMQKLKTIIVEKRLKIGDIVVSNIADTNINVVATKNI
ncbi:MAG TPA: DUF1667 domain-containing protein [Clostridia bacterium]|nr:DUF1667 domain-containing protein [Clostridia bacterium]